MFLLPDWLSRRLTLPGSFMYLRLHRPATLDLILTKMMRGADPEDLADIEFMLANDRVTEAQLRTAFEQVRLPDIQELRDAFRAAQPKVIALVRSRLD